jgi:cytochrome c biogenesis protein CcmG, thiol:disulfide interchange protein DsbE
MRSMGWHLAGLGLAGLVAISACGERAHEAEAPEAPEYRSVTIHGDSVDLADLRGDVVLLNVWATWCAPCRVEIPELQALHEEHADRGLRVVGVTVDSRNAIADVHAFIEEFGMTYDVWVDPDHRVLDRFGAAGVPITVLIDREGRVAWRHLGMFQREDPRLVTALQNALGDD